MGLLTARRALKHPSPALVDRVIGLVRQPLPSMAWHKLEVEEVSAACGALTEWNVPRTGERIAAARAAWQAIRPINIQRADECLLLARLLEKKP